MAVAYFSTWTTYGTWLPGDQRGWFEARGGLREPDALRRLQAALVMTEAALTLDAEQRQFVESTISDHCTLRKWLLHAVNCRSNHVHVVVSAPGRPIEVPRQQFKSWCTRRLREREQGRTATPREHWWTERGWDSFIDDDEGLAEVIAYVLERQGPR